VRDAVHLTYFRCSQLLGSRCQLAFRLEAIPLLFRQGRRIGLLHLGRTECQRFDLPLSGR